MPRHETYRATGALEIVAIIVTLAAGTALSIAILSRIPKDVHGGLGFLLLLASTLPTVAALWLVIAKLARRQAKKLAAALEPEGFVFRHDPTLEEQTRAIESIARQAMLTPRPAHISWVARRNSPQGESIALRHSEVVGSGKAAQEIVHLVVAIPLPAGTTTGVWLTRESFLQRRARDAQGFTDIEIGDPVIDRTFRILAHDPAEPRRVLAIAELRELLLAGPSRESWALAPTHAMCIFRADTNAHGIRVMLRRARQAADLLARHGGTVPSRNAAVAAS